MSPVQEKSHLVTLRLLAGVHPATRSVKSTHADNALEGVRQNKEIVRKKNVLGESAVDRAFTSPIQRVYACTCIYMYICFCLCLILYVSVSSCGHVETVISPIQMTGDKQMFPRSLKKVKNMTLPITDRFRSHASASKPWILLATSTNTWS